MPDMWKSQCPLSVLQKRAFLLNKIRGFFSKRHVLEVETPILSSSGNTDVNIDSFTSQMIMSNQSKSYLRTSPEFPLKRLLCCGIGDVFEIGKVFRKGEYSTTHNCEFTMLEWYRIEFEYNDLIQEVTELISELSKAFDCSFPNTEILTFNQCFMNQLNINVFEVTSDELNEICHNFDYSGSQLTKNEALDYLFATQIQPSLNKHIITYVTHYPATQAALAEINPEDSNTALRFEVFYQGHELGNGYQELTHSQELLNRFILDNKSRVQNGLTEVQIDYNLIEAMKHGMPKCSGIAIGLDRLLMVLMGTSSIHDVMPFNALNS